MYHTLIDAEPINNCVRYRYRRELGYVSQFVLVWQAENELGDRTLVHFELSSYRC